MTQCTDNKYIYMYAYKYIYNDERTNEKIGWLLFVIFGCVWSDCACPQSTRDLGVKPLEIEGCRCCRKVQSSC